MPFLLFLAVSPAIGMGVGAGGVGSLGNGGISGVGAGADGATGGSGAGGAGVVGGVGAGFWLFGSIVIIPPRTIAYNDGIIT